MKTKQGFLAPVLVAVSLTAPLAYVGSYVALLQTRTRLCMQNDGRCAAQFRSGYWEAPE
jgi:hypothetical protein